MSKLYLLLSITLFYINYTAAQECTVSDTILIKDLDTTYVNLLIEDIGNNDLSAPDQGVENVRIKFKHAKVADLRVNLISPSGQKVNLMGPMISDGEGTLNVNWNVNFIRSGLMADPDADFADVWDNENNWIGFNTYQGSYYPFNGALDDVNTGGIVGLWRLEVIDLILAGNEGNDQLGEVAFVSEFGISFRNNTGLKCLACDAPASVLDVENVEGCKGSHSLVFDLNQTIEDANPDYEYGYIITKVGNFDFQTDNSLDLRTALAGTYTICGLSYFDDLDADDINQYDSIEDLNDAISSDALCAKVSDNCAEISIIDLGTPEQQVFNACEGEVVTINGQDFTASGKYEITTPIGPYCDSVSIADIRFEDITIDFRASAGLLSCDDKTLELNPVGVENYASYSWEATLGGVIDQERPDGTVIVSRPGQYVITVSTELCEESFSYLVEADASFNELSISGKDITCPGESVTLMTEFDGMYDEFNWAADAGQPFINDGLNIEVLNAGTYTLTLTNVQGCTFVESFMVQDFTIAIQLSQTEIELNCENQEQIVKLEGLNSGIDYDVSWSKGSLDLGSDLSLTISQSGEYTALIEDTQGDCSSELKVTVTDVRPTLQILVNEDSITCRQDTVLLEYIPLGTATITGQSWYEMPGQKLLSTNLTHSVTKPSDYLLIIETEEGCQFRKEFTIKNKAIPEPIELEDIYKTCYETPPLVANPDADLMYTTTYPDGTIVVGIGNATMLGKYKIEGLSSSTGCLREGFVTVFNDNDDNVGLPDASFVVELLTCSNPTPSIRSSLSSLQYNYIWNGPNIISGATTNEPQVGEAGQYITTISIPGTSCQNTYLVNVRVDTTRTLDIVSDSINCLKDTATLSINTDYTFDAITWSGPGISPTNANSVKVTMPLTYYVSYTIKENGCPNLDSITVPRIQYEPALTITASKDFIQCEDEVEFDLDLGIGRDSVSLIRWDGPGIDINDQTKINVVNPGLYRAIAIGFGDCADTTTFELMPDTLPPNFSLVKDGDIFCNNLEVTIDMEDDTEVVSLTWDDHEGIISNSGRSIMVSEPSTYIVTTVGNNNCVRKDSIMITDQREYPIYTLLDSVITCSKSSIDIGIESDAAYSVSWEGPDIPIDYDQPTFKVSEIGTYYLDITNGQECSVLDTVTVTVDTIRPAFNVEVEDVITCEVTETRAFAEAVDGWSYAWSDNVSTIAEASISTPGEYTLIVTAENGCSAEKMFVVEADTSRLAILEITADSLSCKDLSYIDVVVDGDVNSYLWTYPDNSTSTKDRPSISIGGLYTVSIFGENGCETQGSIEVSDDRLFPVIEVEDIYVRCDGAPSPFRIDTIAEGSEVIWEGLNVNYFDKGFDAAATEEGIYEAIAVNAAGCQARDTFNVINEVYLPTFDLSAGFLYCDGAQLMAIDVDDDEAIRWIGPSVNTTNPNPIVDELGVYNLIVTSIYGCNDTMSIQVADGRVYPQISFTQEAAYQCLTESVPLSVQVVNIASNRLSYKWNALEGGEIDSGEANDRIIASGLGLYEIIVMDSLTKCISKDTFLLEREEQSFQSLELEINDPTCEEYDNGSINIISFSGDYPPYTTYVNGFNYGNQSMINYLSPGVYELLVIDDIGCEVQDTIEIYEPINPVITLPMDTSVYLGDRIDIKALVNKDVSNLDSIIWSGFSAQDTSLNQTFTVVEPTEVFLTIIDDNGCIAEASFRIDVIQPEQDVLPNVFKPSSAMNSRFYIPENPAFESVVQFAIYDNWGGLVYEDNDVIMGDASDGWDGTLNGKKSEHGVYVYRLITLLKSGEEKEFYGTLTLIR